MTASTHRRVGRTRRGLDATLRSMRQLGHLADVDDGIVALTRVAADELDAAVNDSKESRYSRAVLIGRYQSALELLLTRTQMRDMDDHELLDALLASVPDNPDA